MTETNNCPICDSKLDSEGLYCEKCGERVKVVAQQKVIEKMPKDKNIILSKLHSPLTLIIAFCGVANILFGITSFGIPELLKDIFMLISTIALFSVFFYSKEQNNAPILAKKIRLIATYDSFCNVLMTILIVIVSIGLGLMMLLPLIGSSMANSLSESSDFTGAGLVGVLIIGVIGAAVIGIICAIKRIYKNRKEYFHTLGEVVASGKNMPSGVPAVSSYVCGGFIIICGIASSATSSFITGLLDGILSSIPSDVSGSLANILPDNNFLLLLMPNLSLGLYFILSGVLMTSIQNGLEANRQLIRNETNELEKIKKETQAVVLKVQERKRLEEEEKKREEDQALKAKEEKLKQEAEARRLEEEEERRLKKQAELDMQEQQRLMMQIMMQQMMQNNPNFNMQNMQQANVGNNISEDKSDNAGNLNSADEANND